MSLPAGKARRDVAPADFCDGGGLEAHGMQVQLWASYRAQHLARTVRGAVLAHWASACDPAIEACTCAATPDGPIAGRS